MGVVVVNKPALTGPASGHVGPALPPMLRMPSLQKEVYKLDPPVCSISDAVGLAWNRSHQLLYCRDQLPWHPSCMEKATAATDYPQYFGIQCRIKVGDSRPDCIENFYEELKANMPELGLAKRAVTAVADALRTFTLQAVHECDRLGLKEYSIRLSGTTGDERGDHLWHFDRQNELATKSLRFISTLWSISLVNPFTGNAPTGSTAIYPPELVSPERRQEIKELIAAKRSDLSWQQVYQTINSTVEGWAAKDFQNAYQPHLPHGAVAVFLGSADGLLHRALKRSEFLYRVVFSINAKLKGDPHD